MPRQSLFPNFEFLRLNAFLKIGQERKPSHIFEKSHLKGVGSGGCPVVIIIFSVKLSWLIAPCFQFIKMAQPHLNSKRVSFYGLKCQVSYREIYTKSRMIFFLQKMMLKNTNVDQLSVLIIRGTISEFSFSLFVVKLLHINHEKS